MKRKHVGGRDATPYFCEKCGEVRKSEGAMNNHKFLCEGGKIIEFLPRNKEAGSPPKMKFRDIQALSECHIWGTADSEDTLRPTYQLNGQTKLAQEHNAAAWGCALTTPLQKEVEYIQCYSENPTEEFVKKLIQKASQLFHEYWEPCIKTNLGKEVYEINDIPIKAILKDNSVKFERRYYLKQRQMPPETCIIGERKKYEEITCLLCQEPFLPDDVRVIDHDHFTGKFFGIAHRSWNSLRRTRAKMNIFLHNASYDFIELLPALMKQYSFGIKTKAQGIQQQSSQKYLSLTLEIYMAKEVYQLKTKKRVNYFVFRIIFRDSLSSFKKSLEKIMEKFPEENLKALKQFFFGVQFLPLLISIPFLLGHNFFFLVSFSLLVEFLLPNLQEQVYYSSCIIFFLSFLSTMSSKVRLEFCTSPPKSLVLPVQSQD